MSRTAVPFEKKVIEWAEVAELAVVTETLAVVSYVVRRREVHGPYSVPENPAARTTLSERKAARRKVKPDGSANVKLTDIQPPDKY